ncbi:hypothetical protein ATS58_003066 [Salmonella enterica subsp. enterica serovar Pensacola]|nr:hypothetical protein [Salmonella enterica subsp. enterica serovar Pensacola]
MSFDDIIKKSSLAHNLKMRNLQTAHDWLTYHMRDFHFGEVLGAYKHLKNRPKYRFGLILPKHITCVSTDKCFFPKKFQPYPCYEVAVLDTEQELVLFYALCFDTPDGICPVTWRIPDMKYDEVLANVGEKFIRHLLENHTVCITYLNNYGGSIQYWLGLLRKLHQEGFLIKQRRNSKSELYKLPFARLRGGFFVTANQYSDNPVYTIKNL